MQQRNIAELYFSPTGGTKDVSNRAARALADHSAAYDLTAPETEGVSFAADDIAIVSLPVFAGRIPPIAADRLRRFSGNGAAALALVVYGNRHYDDALLELCDVLRERGFRVAGAAAIVARHSIAPEIGEGRPDDGDYREIAAFMEAAGERIASGDLPDALPLPGNRPYKTTPPGGFPIAVSEACTQCGTCAAHCPVGAIPLAAPSTTDLDACIRCMRCIRICPEQARAVPPEAYAKLQHFLSAFRTPRENEFFPDV